MGHLPTGTSDLTGISIPGRSTGAVANPGVDVPDSTSGTGETGEPTPIEPLGTRTSADGLTPDLPLRTDGTGIVDPLLVVGAFALIGQAVVDLSVGARGILANGSDPEESLGTLAGEGSWIPDLGCGTGNLNTGISTPVETSWALALSDGVPHFGKRTVHTLDSVPVATSRALTSLGN